MLENQQLESLNPDRVKSIIEKVGPDVEDIFGQIKQLGHKNPIPADLSYGIVAGFLRGKGFTWEECFLGMDRFIRVVNSFPGVISEVSAKFSVHGQEDGGVRLKTEIIE